MSDNVPTIICALREHPRYTVDFDTYLIELNPFAGQGVDRGDQEMVWYANTKRGYVLTWRRDAFGHYLYDVDGHAFIRMIKGKVTITRRLTTEAERA